MLLCTTRNDRGPTGNTGGVRMKKIVAAAVLAAVISGSIWYLLHRSVLPPDLNQAIASLSYNFAGPDQRELNADTRPLLDRAAADIDMLANITGSIRLYAASGIFEPIPAMAREHGMSVIAGAWVGDNKEFASRELEAAIRAANRNTNVRSIVVGNETLLREELTVPELAQLLRHARQRVRVPVTTGETWDIWLKHPELVREVDYIAAHMLPYWEGIPADHAVTYAFERYDELRRRYPGKKVVIAEFGWPSQGYNNHAADTGPLIQARVLREFIAEANRRGVAYNVIEAIDQPWKDNEGTVGAYWGLFDADRQAKFPLVGKVEKDSYPYAAGLAVALGLLLTLLLLHRRQTSALQALAFAAAGQVMAAPLAIAVLHPFESYLNVGSAVAWGLGVLLILPLTLMTLVKVNEMAEVTLGRRPRRLIDRPLTLPAGRRAPKVSIQIPAYREAPDMLIETLNSVAALDYPDFEALVIVNNTPEEEFWRPIEAHCAALGERFKFVNLPQVDGFKAGALTRAEAWMAPDAEVIALIDADYVVHPDWLKDLVPAFCDPQVAMVQAPQDHRDHRQSAFKRIMNSEYAGFFDIGMVQRNEDDAIVAHGTMLLLRRSAFDEVGGWASDTITEDTELGLRLFAAGYRSAYTNRRYGWGLLPDTYKAFKSQRDRWAYGAVQIMRKHWRLMRPGRTGLSPAQKFQYVAGWSFWLSDAFGVLAAYMNLLWVPMILFVGVLIPTVPFILPVLVAFVVNLLHCALLYRARVGVPMGQVAGAALAAMSLQFTVARAIARGLLKVQLAFKRTEKGGLTKLLSRTGKERIVRAETVSGLALMAAAAVLHLSNKLGAREVDLFAITLAIQSLPFLAAAVMFNLERIASDGLLGRFPWLGWAARLRPVAATAPARA